MGCAQSVELCLEMWRLARMRGHDDERSGTVTSCSVMRDGSYRSYVSHEDLVPEVGVTTPEGCYCLLVNKSTTPVVCDVTDMADMVRQHMQCIIHLGIPHAVVFTDVPSRHRNEQCRPMRHFFRRTQSVMDDFATIQFWCLTVAVTVWVMVSVRACGYGYNYG